MLNLGIYMKINLNFQLIEDRILFSGVLKFFMSFKVYLKLRMIEMIKIIFFPI